MIVIILANFREDLPPLAPARPFSTESDQSLGTRLSELAYREELKQVDHHSIHDLIKKLERFINKK